MTVKENAIRSAKILLVALLVFAVPVTLVTYLYLEHKRKYFSEQKFRQLALEVERLQATIENYAQNVLPNAVREVEAWADPIEAATALKSRQEIWNTFIEEETGLRLLRPPEFRDASSPPRIVPKGAAAWLHLDYPKLVDGKELHYDVAAELLQESESASAASFENLLLIGNDGRVIYQRGPGAEKLPEDGLHHVILGGHPSKLHVREIAAIMHEAGGVGQLLGVTRLERKLDIAGETYSLFLQPFHTSLQQREAGRTIEVEINGALAGLSTVSQLRRESMTVSYTALLLVIFLFLLIGLSWPLLKLWLQGPYDLLGRGDIVFLATSALLVTGLLSFFLADLCTYPRFEEGFDDQLARLAEKVDRNFRSEVTEICRLLRVFAQNPPEKDDNVLLDLDLNNLPLGFPARHPFLNLVAWVDAKGEQERKWAVRRYLAAKVRVKDRVYFKDLKAERKWTWRVDGADIGFWLGPVTSRTTGEKTAIAATPRLDNPDAIVTVAVKLVSLREPILPDGFGFAVIAANGDVLFHSDQSREGENLFVETDRDAELRAAVAGRTRELINVAYLGKGHRFFVRPIEGTTWSLIAFRDKELFRTTNLEMLSGALVLFLLYMLLAVWPIGALLGWDPSWCWPQPPDNCPSGQQDPAGAADRNRTFLRLTIVYLLVSLALVTVITLGFPRLTLLTMVLVPPACLLLAYRWLKPRRRRPSRRFWTGVAILCLLALPFLISMRPQLPRLSWQLAIVAMTILAVALVMYRHGTGRDDAIVRRIRALLERRDWNESRVVFSSTTTLLVLITAVLPAQGLFSITRDLETRMFVHHAERSLLYALRSRSAQVKAAYPEFSIARRLDSELDLYHEFFFNTELLGAAASEDSAYDELRGAPCGSEANPFLQTLLRARPLYNENAVQNHALAYDEAGDCSLVWRTNGPREELAVLHTTARLGFDRPDVAWSTRWWLAVPILGTALVLLVAYLTDRLAGRVFLSCVPEPIRFRRENWTPETVVKDTLLLGPQFCGKSEMLKHDRFFAIDLRDKATRPGWAAELRASKFGNKNAVAIDHLEYRFEDPETNLEKLTLLQDLVAANKVIVIASTVDPLHFVFSAKPADGQKNQHKDSDANLSAQAGNRWAGLMSVFTKEYVRSEGDPTGFRTELDDIAGLKKEVRATLAEECEPSDYLQGIGLQLARESAGLALSRDQVIAELLDRTKAHYQTLWAACSREERLALYDLAQDDFVNSENPGLRSLLRRGLVVRDPAARTMNKSFRRFILDTGRLEHIKGWDEITAPTRWDAVKWPLFGIIALGVLVLFVTQREIFDTSVGFVSALGAGLVAVFKLLDVMRTNRAVS